MKAGLIALGLAAAGSLTGLFAPTDEKPTYRGDIAPLFAKKCVSCHQSGGPGPFKLLTYEDVRKRGDLLEIVTLQRKMPPTDAVSDFGTIADHEKLTDGEAMVIQDWIRGGMPDGSGAVPEVRPQSGWRMGQPSQVVSVTPVSVPAEGNEIVKETVVTLNLDRERELYAFDILPKSPKVARQFVVALQRPGEYSPFKATGIRANQLIGAWAVGYRPWKLPDDAGIVLKPGDQLCIRMLYHPSGKRDDGSFDLALYFGDSPRQRHPRWMTIGLDQFEISGQEPYYTDLEAAAKLDADAQIISMLPEARSIASHAQLQVVGENGPLGTLLNISRWEKRWVGAYNFETPPSFPAGTTLRAEFQYRNSNHDDPSLTVDQVKRLPKNAPVHFGPADTDELFWMHVQVLPKS